jgi:hypothetical protein
MYTDKREIIFDTNNDNYRVVCRFGYDNNVTCNWYGHIQKKITRKKYFLFGKLITKYIEVDRCWWLNSPESVIELKEKAMTFYDECIELPIRNRNKAINIK